MRPGSSARLAEREGQCFARPGGRGAAPVGGLRLVRRRSGRDGHPQAVSSHRRAREGSKFPHADRGLAGADPHHVPVSDRDVDSATFQVEGYGLAPPVNIDHSHGASVIPDH